MGKKYKPDGIRYRVVKKTGGAEAEIAESIMVILILVLGWGTGGVVPLLHYGPAVLPCTKILLHLPCKPHTRQLR